MDRECFLRQHFICIKFGLSVEMKVISLPVGPLISCRFNPLGSGQPGLSAVTHCILWTSLPLLVSIWDPQCDLNPRSSKCVMYCLPTNSGSSVHRAWTIRIIGKIFPWSFNLLSLFNFCDILLWIVNSYVG